MCLPRNGNRPGSLCLGQKILNSGGELSRSAAIDVRGRYRLDRFTYHLGLAVQCAASVRQVEFRALVSVPAKISVADYATLVKPQDRGLGKNLTMGVSFICQ